MPIVAAAIIGGASLIGGERANASQRSQANQANAFSAQEQALNRDFQREMSNTAVQRRMDDMRAGGINPILAANSAASQPTGGAATGQQAQIRDTITPAVSTAIQANHTMAQADLVREQLKPIMDQVGTVGANSWLTSAQRALASIDYNQREAAIRLLEEQIISAQKQAIIDGVKADIMLEGLQKLREAGIDINNLNIGN